MFKLKSTGVFFENRKQAIKTMGAKRYNKALAERDFEFNIDKNNNNN